MLNFVSQVKDFMGSVDDALRWMARYSKDIKSSALPGALPKTAQNEFDKFMVI